MRLNDWIIQFSPDTKPVLKSIVDLERRFAKMSGNIAAASAKLDRAGLGTAMQESRLRQRLLQEEMDSKKQLARTESENAKKNIALSKERSQAEKEIAQSKMIQARQEKMALRDAERAKRQNRARVSTGPRPFSKVTPNTFETRRRTTRQFEAQERRASSSLEKLNLSADPRAAAVSRDINTQMERMRTAQRAMNAETFTTSTAWQKARSSMDAAQKEMMLLNTEAARMASVLSPAKRLTTAFADSLRNFARSIASVFLVFEGVKYIYQTTKAFETMRATMLLSSGDSKAAAADMEFLKKMTDELGLSTLETAKDFAKFAVAGRASGMTTEDIRATFRDLSISIASTGLTVDQAKGAFLGFQQMLAGPVVQAQEMNQIIERMPQFSAMAKTALAEMGFEAENWRSVVAQGTVDSKEFIRVVGRLMREQAIQTGAYAKAIDNVNSAQARFKNATDAAANAIGEAGLNKILKAMFKTLTALVQGLTPVIVTVVGGIGVLVDVITPAVKTVHELLQALGFQSGLGGVLVGLGLFFASGSFLRIISGLKQLYDWVRKLTIASIIAQAVALGPAGIAKVVGGAAAAVGTVMALDYAVGKAMGGSNSTSNSVTNNMTFNTKSDSMEIANRVSEATSQGLSQ